MFKCVVGGKSGCAYVSVRLPLSVYACVSVRVCVSMVLCEYVCMYKSVFASMCVHV
jgi:hypothetical protein